MASAVKLILPVLALSPALLRTAEILCRPRRLEAQMITEPRQGVRAVARAPCSGRAVSEHSSGAIGARARLHGRPEPSADLLRQLDDDPLRTADVADPITVFV